MWRGSGWAARVCSITGTSRGGNSQILIKIPGAQGAQCSGGGPAPGLRVRKSAPPAARAAAVPLRALGPHAGEPGRAPSPCPTRHCPCSGGGGGGRPASRLRRDDVIHTPKHASHTLPSTQGLLGVFSAEVISHGISSVCWVTGHSPGIGHRVQWVQRNGLCSASSATTMPR